MAYNFQFLKLLNLPFIRSCTNFSNLRRSPLSNQIFQCRRVLSTSSNVSSSSKDLVVKDDIIMHNLRTSIEVTDVLELLQRHLPVMNAQHQVQALTTLFQTHKSSSYSLSKEDVTRKPEFRALCNAILNHSRIFELNELINCLKCLAYFQVPSNSRIIQSHLNLITKQINSMSLAQIMYLDFLIGYLEVCPLVQALKIALPIVFEVQLSKWLDQSNLSLVCDCLHFASHRRVTDSCFDFLISVLTAYQGAIPLKNAVSVLKSLCDRKNSNDSHVVILYRVLDIITDSIEDLSSHEVQNLLSKVLHKGSFNSFFYHSSFIDKCILFMVQSNLDVKDAFNLLHKLNKANYSSILLLDHISEKLSVHPNFLLESFLSNSIVLMNGLSYSNYKPKHWNVLQETVLQVFRKNLNTFELPWLNICLNLIVLDCWPIDLLNKVFETDFLVSFLNRENNHIDYKVLLNLYQAVMTLYPGDYPGILPPQSIVDKALPYCDPNADYPLLPALTKGLGGKEYIHTGVHTRYGHFIDHVIVLRKGGYVVASNKSQTSAEEVSLIRVENIEVPAESTIIGVLVIRPKQCAINTDQYKGHVALHQRSLEATGIAVVSILLQKWNSLLDHEKIPYLMQELKQKADIHEAAVEQ